MSAGFKPGYAVDVMQAVDLDAVIQIESTIYSHPWTRGNFNDSLTAGHQAWVVRLKGEIIAYSVMMLVLDEAHLFNLSVAKPYQQKGLGRELLAYMIDQATALGARQMYLEVRSSNVAAITLYEKMGFVENSRRKGYYPAEGGREDAVLMGLAMAELSQ